MKKFCFFLILLLLYQLFGMLQLMRSSYFNAVAYFIFPPEQYAELEVQRLPIMFGTRFSGYLLNNGWFVAVGLDDKLVHPASVIYFAKTEGANAESLERAYVHAEYLLTTGHHHLVWCYYPELSVYEAFLADSFVDERFSTFLHKFYTLSDLSKCVPRQ